MNNLPNIKDTMTYVKDNKKNFLSAIVIAFAVFGMFFAISIKLSQSKIDTEAGINEDFTYQFDFIVENKEGNLNNNPYTTKYVLDHYILEQQLKTEKKDSVELTESYDIIYNGQVGVMSLRSSGDIKVSQLFYDTLSRSKSDYFNDRSIFLLTSKPEKYESDSKLKGQSFSLKTVIVYVMGIIVMSVLLGFLLSWMKEARSKTISSNFYLDTDVPIVNLETIYLHNVGKEKELLTSAVNGMSIGKKLIITTDREVSEMLGNNDTFDVIENMVSDQILGCSYQEVVLICRKNKTSKIWYNTQLELLKNLNIHVKCVYF